MKQKNRDTKIGISIHNVPSDKGKDSVLVEKVADNEPGRNLIIPDQVLNENVYNSSNNIVFFW